MKDSNDTIGNRTRDLLTCSPVPQPTAPPRAPATYTTNRKKSMPSEGIETAILVIKWLQTLTSNQKATAGISVLCMYSHTPYIAHTVRYRQLICDKNPKNAQNCSLDVYILCYRTDISYRAYQQGVKAKLINRSRTRVTWCYSRIVKMQTLCVE